MYNKALESYQNTHVTTAKPEKILLMLYEGCLKFLKLARLHMKDKNIEQKGKYISKALAIISELINTLDHKVGGQISVDLENLYMFMMDKLIEANAQNKTEHIDVVEKLLLTLYDAWKDIIENPRPDGVPSKKLQPELYAQYEANLKRKS